MRDDNSILFTHSKHFFSWITTVNEVDLREQLNTKKYGSHTDSNLL
jgi:hypothetical protein